MDIDRSPGVTRHDPAVAPRASDAAVACWCGGSSWRPQFRAQQFGLLRCGACGSYRIDPMPLHRNADGAAFYSDYYADKTSAARAAVGDAPNRCSRFWQVVRQVPSLAAPGEAALDIGSGEGTLCEELRAAGWRRVVGVEISAARVARARHRYPEIEFFEGTLERLPLPEQAFDLITMDNVIEHLPDPRAVLTRVASLLAPGGRCVLITPNMNSGSFRLLGRRWTPELAPHAHVYLFTAASLMKLMSQSGLITDAHGSFHVSPCQWDEWVGYLRNADLKSMLWQTGQHLGALNGRLLRAGAMLFTVGRRA
jgi:2-polyprenyl-3-methyl-5-hydroxy-6-metoxy-1,4-benzoquinol methylase